MPLGIEYFEKSRKAQEMGATVLERERLVEKVVAELRKMRGWSE